MYHWPDPAPEALAGNVAGGLYVGLVNSPTCQARRARSVPVVDVKPARIQTRYVPVCVIDVPLRSVDMIPVQFGPTNVWKIAVLLNEIAPDAVGIAWADPSGVRPSAP